MNVNRRRKVGAIDVHRVTARLFDRVGGAGPSSSSARCTRCGTRWRRRSNGTASPCATWWTRGRADSSRLHEALELIVEFVGRQKQSPSKVKALSFWDIAHQYVRCVKGRYDETALIRFRKVVIELLMHYDPAPDPHSDEVVNLCVDYIVSIGES